MSDKTDRAADYLGHILQAIERIDRYTGDMTEKPLHRQIEAIIEELT